MSILRKEVTTIIYLCKMYNLPKELEDIILDISVKEPRIDYKRKHKKIFTHCLKYIPKDIWWIRPGSGSAREEVRLRVIKEKEKEKPYKCFLVDGGECFLESFDRDLLVKSDDNGNFSPRTKTINSLIKPAAKIEFLKDIKVSITHEEELLLENYKKLFNFGKTKQNKTYHLWGYRDFLFNLYKQDFKRTISWVRYSRHGPREKFYFVK